MPRASPSVDAFQQLRDEGDGSLKGLGDVSFDDQVSALTVARRRQLDEHVAGLPQRYHRALPWRISRWMTSARRSKPACVPRVQSNNEGNPNSARC